MGTPSREKPSGRLFYALLIALGFYLLYFAGLGSYPLLDPDEPVFGQVAKEIAAGSGWLTPHYHGQVWFDKPPLFYWLSAAAASLFGPTELALRLPSALLAVALVLLVYALASYDFGRRAGIFAAVVMATSLQQIILAHAAVTDMTLAFCLTGSLYACRRWLDAAGRARFGWITLCGAMAGLGMLAKGPVAPVLLGLTFVIHLWWSRRLRSLASTDALAGIAVFLIVALPWYVTMYAAHRRSFVEGFLVTNNVLRFLKPEHAGQTGSWTSYFRNVPVLFLFFFPWSVFLPQGIARSWKANHGARLAAVWFAVVFVFFSISKTQLVTYIFPLYPAAAVFVGNLWALSTLKDTGVERGMRLAAWVAVGISVLAAAALARSAHAKYPEAEWAAFVLGIILVLTTASALVWLIRHRGRSAPAVWIVGTGMAALTLWLVYAVMPLAAARASTRDLARRALGVPRGRVIGLDVDRPSLLFYLGSRLERTMDAPAARRALAGDSPVVVICRQSRAADISQPGCVWYAEARGLVAVANASAAHSKGAGRP